MFGVICSIDISSSAGSMPGAPLVAEALLDVERFALDDLRDAPRAAQNVFQLRDRLDQLGVFILDLLPLEPNERSQTHIDDRLCRVRSARIAPKSLLGLVGRLASANDLDDLIDVVERDAIAFEQVRALLRFTKVVRRSRVMTFLRWAMKCSSSCLRLSTCGSIAADRWRAASHRHERQHVEAERRLQRRVLEELIEHDLWRRVRSTR